MKTFMYLFVIFSLISTLSFSQIYVDINQANDDGDGSTWGNAKKYLQSALAIASSGDIYVAEGTYYPDEGTGQTNNDNTSTFQMISGVDILGGYPAGGGTRDPSTYVSILSGDLDQDETNSSSDAYHVVTGANTSILDGFTITGGYARDPNFYGAGIVNSSVSPTINDCIFTDNYAQFGGPAIHTSNSSITITNCEFSNNQSGSDGGAIYNNGQSIVTISNCDFLYNTAGGHGGAIFHAGTYNTNIINVSDCIFDNNYSGYDGGAVHHNVGDSFIRCTFSNNSGRDGGAVMSGGESPVFTNCVFLNNTARSEFGGGINAYYSIPALKHCSFKGNTAPSAGDGFIRSPGATAITITNSIFWGSNSQISGANITVTYSDVQLASGTYTGTGNINNDPLFVSGTDLHLTDNSPCIGAGTDLSISDDRDGNTRPDPVATSPDMGAYENSRGTPLPVELSSFTATVKNEVVELEWRTETEVDNYGFEILRCVENNDWLKVGFVEGFGNSNSPRLYSFTDKYPTGGSKFKYRLKQIDADGEYEYSNIIEVVITPNQCWLSRNYPNPFNPTTKIKYSIPQSSNVVIRVFDILGNEIETLVNEEKPAGTYELTWYAEGLPSGVYFYQQKAGSFIETKKMLLIK